MLNWIQNAANFNLEEFLNSITDPAEKIALENWQQTWLTRKLLKTYKNKTNGILRYFKDAPPLYIRLNYLKEYGKVFEELKNWDFER